MFDVDKFLAVFPEFGDIPSARIEFIGEWGEDFLSKTAFGKWWERAVWLFVAHRLATQFDISAKVAELGEVGADAYGMLTTSQSASTSSLSESKTASAFANSDNPLYFDLSKTRYGIMLLELIELLMPGGLLVCSGDGGFFRGDYRYGPRWGNIYAGKA